VLIPKVRDRAPGAPHGGLVLGRHGASVRVWLPSDSEPVAVKLRVSGEVRRLPGDFADYARQDLALGPATAAALAGSRVAVIGTGGLGWEIATLLWTHGVGSLVLIDPDLVEGHNRPRLRGSVPADVGQPKTEALNRCSSRTGWEAMSELFKSLSIRGTPARPQLRAT
jgi:molybdopterin/thiamine biosynthesis adenylyltransferase